MKSFWYDLTRSGTFILEFLRLGIPIPDMLPPPTPICPLGDITPSRIIFLSILALELEAPEKSLGVVCSMKEELTPDRRELWLMWSTVRSRFGILTLEMLPLPFDKS